MHAPDRARLRLAASALAGALLLTAIFFAIGDTRAFVALLSDVRPGPLAAALLLTAVSYVLFHTAIATYARACGIPFPAVRSFPATCVSQAVNNIVSTGGLAGTTLRVIGYSRLGMRPGSATAISAMATLGGDLVNFFGVLAALALVGAQGRVPRSVTWWAGGAAIAMIAAWVAFHLALRKPAIRASVAFRIDAFSRRVAARLGSRLAGADALDAFRRDTFAGFDTLLARPSTSVFPLVFVTGDLLVRGTVLAAAFAAVGHPVPLPVVLTGFLIGIAAAALSLIPAGLGALEGSMGATFAWMGVPLETAAAAIVVFRFAYYVVPVVLAPLLSRLALGPRRASA